MEKLMEILNDIHPEIDFTHADRLISDGIFDSFDIVTLVGEINEGFNIEIGVEDLLPNNFNSPASIMNLITRLQNR